MFEPWILYFSFILHSICINYKSWIFLLLSLLILCDFRWVLLFTFVIGMISSHIIHYWHHFEHSYPHNIIHDYHHRYNLPFNHFIQLLLEFVSITGIIPLKYALMDLMPFLSFVDNWIVLFYYLFYTTIHNVNYTIFHVNNVHEIHHQEFLKNMGPDICDLLFGTKYNPEEGLENTDHYIPNIIFCTVMVLTLKYGWNHSSNDLQKWYTVLSKGIFYGSALFLFITSVCLYKMDIDQAFERDVNEFSNAVIAAK